MNAGPARLIIVWSSVTIAALLVSGCVQTVDSSRDSEVARLAVMLMETAIYESVEATVAARPAIPPTAVPEATPAPQLLPVATPPAGCQLLLTTEKDAPLREGPGQGYREVGRMAAGQSTAVVARDAFYAWWMIVIEGRIVWVQGAVVVLNDCAGYPPEVTPPPLP